MNTRPHPAPRKGADPAVPDRAKPDRPAGPKYPTRSPQERQTFHPDQRRKLLELFCTARGVNTADDLPAFLKEETVVPLRVGTHQDLAARYNLPGTRKKDLEMIPLDRAMARYCRSRAYQHAILTSETRFNIDMEPDETVTDANRENAINILREINRRRQEREERDRIGPDQQGKAGTTPGVSAAPGAAKPRGPD